MKRGDSGDIDSQNKYRIDEKSFGDCIPFCSTGVITVSVAKMVVK